MVRGRLMTRLGLLLGGGALVALAYVWLVNEAYQLGLEIQNLNRELETWRETNTRNQARVFTLESPRSLDRKLREFGLDLRVPDDAHTVLVWEPVGNVIEEEQTRLAQLR